MRNRSIVVGVIAGLLLVSMAGGAFAQSPHGPGRPGMSGRSGMMGSNAPGRHAGFASEAEYLSVMIPHHEEAVERARELLAMTERDEMIDLLEGIIAEQSAEIELMETWLEQRYPEVEASDEYEPMMRSYEGLDTAEAERAFIEDMIPHHMHAVMSSRMLLRGSHVEHEDTGELATDIIGSQLAEIERMRVYARDWYGHGRGDLSHRHRGGGIRR